MLSQNTYDELCKYRNNPVQATTEELSERSKYLLENKFICSATTKSSIDINGNITIFSTSYKITDIGIDELASYEEQKQEATEAKKREKYNYIFQIILMILTFFLGLIVEHFGKILTFVKSVFS